MQESLKVSGYGLQEANKIRRTTKISNKKNAELKNKQKINCEYNKGYAINFNSKFGLIKFVFYILF